MTRRSKSSPSTHLHASHRSDAIPTGRMNCVGLPTLAWSRHRTSLPSATGPTRTRSRRLFESAIAALVQNHEREQSANHSRDARGLAVVDHFAQDQERPDNGERGLSYLRDADRADLNRLLRVDEQPLR